MRKTLFISFLFLSSIVYTQSIIGTTTYDLQTNASSKNRIRVYEDGRVSVVWTGATSLVASWPERGMFYNHNNGAGWGPSPVSRIEGVRTGFGEILTVGSREVVLSHDGISGIRVYQNAMVGSTTWTELGGSLDVVGFWPASFCPAGTNDIYLVNSNANPVTAINFSRSDNGGNTWSVLNSPLPFLTEADGISALTGEVYQIAVDGNDVYILYGSVWTDLKLLHSPSKGSPGSWTETIIHDFPIENYAAAEGEITDIDGDAIADTIDTSDELHKMIITNDGTVHIWTGHYGIYDNNPEAGFNWLKFSNGIYYWNSTMTDPVLLDLFFDWNNADGLNNPFAGLGTDLAMYGGTSLTSMAGAAYDESTGNLYLLYTMPIEYTDYFGDPENPSAQSFRDIFGVFSDDNGVSWSEAVNLTNTAELNRENVYAFAYDKVMDNKIHIMWMQDDEPGTALDAYAPDPVVLNKIRYQAFDITDFGAAPACDIAAGPTGLFAGPVGSTTVTLNWNAVPGADKYQVMVYPVADPADKTKKKPGSNTTNIMGLIPETDYAWKVKTICPGGAMSPYSATGFFTTGPLRVGDISGYVIIYPNPNDGNFSLQIDGYENKNVNIQILNTLGEIIYFEEIVIENNEFSKSLSLNNLPAGMYHIRMFCEDEMIVKSLIIE